MQDAIVVERHGRNWAVKHKDSFLGFTKTRDEAAIIAQDLVEWITSRGGEARLLVEETRSFQSRGIWPGAR